MAPGRKCLAPAFVAQICNLLYRRIAFCEPRHNPGARHFRRPAECNSAIQQIANLRYHAGPCAKPDTSGSEEENRPSIKASHRRCARGPLLSKPCPSIMSESCSRPREEPKSERFGPEIRLLTSAATPKTKVGSTQTRGWERWRLSAARNRRNLP